MEGKLCPRCGAYWSCDCSLQELSYFPQPGCEHDWTEAVGVELDEDLVLGEAQVLVCRLCGIYAVEEKSA